MAITLSDIAQRTGVSKMTVSLVLNHKRGGLRISKATRQKVLTAAQELNYIPSFSARSLVRGRTNSIGFQCGNIRNPHYTELAEVAVRELESRDYHLLIAVTQWVSERNDLECLESLIGRGVDGVIFFGIALQPETKMYDYVRGRKFPLVQVSNLQEGFSCVTSDWRPGMAQAIEHLKAKGHHRVGNLRSRYIPPDLDPKQQAFLWACREYGVEPVTYVCEHVQAEDGRQVARDPNRPTALIATSDFTAQWVLKGLRMEGLEIPRDMALVGVDGTQIAEVMHPTLTSIAQDRQTIMKETVEMLMNLIDEKEDPGRHVKIPTSLVVREST